jgi:hypothetical protein
MWVERVTAARRRAYERRLGAPITRLPGTGIARPAATCLPATFVTGVALRSGVDMSGLPALAATLRDPLSVFAGTATAMDTFAGRRGFFVVRRARFGRGPGSQGFLVVFVPAGWLSLSMNEASRGIAISLDGRRLEGGLATTPAAGQSFDALTRRWNVDLAREPATALQATLPWLAARGRGVGFPAGSERLAEDLLDRTARQSRFRDEAGGRARGQQLGELGLGVRGYQDDVRRPRAHRAPQRMDRVESALHAEIDVDQHEVRPQLRRALDRFRRIGRATDYGQALALEQAARRRPEGGVVIHDETRPRHALSISLTERARQARACRTACDR